MTRRSFYLSNLRQISGCGKNDESGGKSEVAKREREREERKNEDSTEDVGVGVASDGDTIHRSRSTASIRSLRPLRLRGLRFTFPRRKERERERRETASSLVSNGRPNVELRDTRFLSLRVSTCLRNVAGRTRRLMLYQDTHDFVSMTMRTKTGGRTSWLGDEEEGQMGRGVGISKRTRLVASIVAYLATSSPRLMRRKRMHVFHGVQ